MSDLQIGLIALGVLLILLVLGFNWWQDRRVRQKMQAQFPTVDQDPLLGANDRWTGEGDAQESVAPRREPGLAGSAQASGSEPSHRDTDDTDEPDPGCEVVIEITFNEPVQGVDLLPYAQSLRQVGRKPVRVFAETEGGRHRSRVHSDEVYASMQVAVLLANRSGPLTAIEWSQAWARAQDVAERFDAHIEGPDQQVVLEQATQLDTLCAALDAQVGLTLILGDAQPAAEVLAVARELGFVAQSSGLAWLADNGSVRFSLLRADGASFDAGMNGIERLSLLLDVPCSLPDPRAFGRMVDVARDLAERLRANLVDDQGRHLSEGAESIIDAQLQELFERLERASLPAGSQRAQRVFA